MRALAIAVVAVVAVVVCAAPRSAHAVVTQPDGTVIPSAMGCHDNAPTGLAAIFACQCTSGGCNIGAACPGNQDPSSCDTGQHGTCEATIWHAWNDDACIPTHSSGLSPRGDASTMPETFQPTCALTFTVISRGTAQFHDVFGWYNVTDHAPAVSDLHVMLDCNAAPTAQVVLDLVGDPAYAGGEIGFFIATPENRAPHGQCAGGNCCASLSRLASDGYVYYSQREFNPDAASSSSSAFVHLLTYDSAISAHKFYFAWEDLFAGGGNNDFTDFVASVEGVECAGGGQTCDTGRPGMCAQGVSVCDSGALGCAPLYAPHDEQCDGIDEDCDGKIDEGAACPAGSVCDRGACVATCAATSEFPCDATHVCDSVRQICVDPACDGVTCPEGQVCSQGTCHAACDGIVCPHGSECFMGQCVDRCANVQCAPGETCSEGFCFAGCNSCDGIQCAAGLVCNAGGGACLDPACPSGCPAGTFCDGGQCTDDCAGAVCPAGQTCQQGHCGIGGDGAGSDGGGDGARPVGGCCSSHRDGVPIWAVAIVGWFALARRRRGRALRYHRG